ncbi:plasmid stabilization system protein [Spirochaetia bacterium]|nr:plasmid stabilization system protein [Spirochaetia bacterium]GHV80326.1 plasmid stabilization system protein [Spirochaetia bacterium]
MQVLLHRSADKYLNRLQPADRDRFDAAFDDLEKEPPEGDIRPYEGNPGVLRLKVGSYRALFKFVDDHILVTHIEPRGQAYTKKTKTKRG